MPYFHNILIFFLFLFPLAQSFAGTIEIDADSQLEFAEQYFSKGEYEKAVAEYERFIYFFPEDERTEQTMYKIGMAYFESREFKAAINAFGKLMEASNFEFQVSNFKKQAYFMISESHLKLNETGLAVSNLRNLLMLANEANDADVRDECAHRIGWIYLETGLWDKARAYFGQISPENRDKYHLEKLFVGLGERKAVKQKSPRIAGALSIIPGAGYLYSGRYRDALTSFLVNSALMYATYEAFDNDSNALGCILSFVEIGFYSGNIYGSVNSAHKYNRGQTTRFIENLKKNAKVSFSSEDKKEFMLSFHYAF